MFPPPVNSRTITQAYESKLDEKWNILFMELVEYKGKNGHCDVPQRNNGSLGGWISSQRTLFRSKKLKADRYEKLVGIGFVFEDVGFASDNEKWNILFMELVEYKEKNGHCNFPTKNGSLGSWISRQRALFRSKKLKEDRYEKLVGIGFVFEKWNILFMELEKYKEKNGHCPTTNNGSLGSWIMYQRALFRSKKLKADCYEKLGGLGSYLRMRDSHPIMKNGIYTSWSLSNINKRMVLVMSQGGMDRLGAGSHFRGNCSDPRKSRRIVMKNLWGLGSYLRL
jgi:hypothetical protein